MINKTSFLNIAIFFIVIGCANNNQNTKSDSGKSGSQQELANVDSNIIKVFVEQDGKITADGVNVTINNLDSSFRKLKERNGIVYYSRSNRQGDPPQESMNVMVLIVKYSVPVKLFTDKTFTTVIN
jgi:biopolymer transport protein ExbD